MRLGVVLLTYNRREYAHTTLRAALDGIVTEHEIQVHIASDGDSQEYIDSLCSLAGGYAPISAITQSNSARGGYGKNYNLAMQAVHASCEWVLPLEDDWKLTRALDVDSLIRDMESLNIGCARLGYIGYTQELSGRLQYGRCGHWLRFDAYSTEPHVFAGHPRVEARTWGRSVGPWSEGLAPGATEFEVAHRPAARRDVAWPLDVVKPRGDMFEHIGTVRSY